MTLLPFTSFRNNSFSSEHTYLFEQDSLFLKWVSSTLHEEEIFLNLMLHEEDFGVPAEWHFFVTLHGNSVTP
jgi:hypothetical protein